MGASHARLLAAATLDQFGTQNVLVDNAGIVNGMAS
jgi:hypothetical protein